MSNDDKGVGDTYVIQRTSSSAETGDEINEKSEDLSAIEQCNDGNDPAESGGSNLPAKTELKRCAASMTSSAAAEMPSKKRKTKSHGSDCEDGYDVFMANLRKYVGSNQKSESLILSNESSTSEGLEVPKTSTPNSIISMSTDTVQDSETRDSIADRCKRCLFNSL